MYRIGIDIGGTFTDCIVIDDNTGDLRRFKKPSTPPNYYTGVLEVLQLAAKDFDLDINNFLKDVEQIIHGTTIATNIILSKEGKDVGLIATKGFRDIIEQWWKEERRYDMKYPPPQPPCPRWLRREVTERIDFSGKVLKELNEQTVIEACNFYQNHNIESIAVSLIFSPINPDHEQKIKRIITQKYPQASVNISSEVLPQLREYERTMATILNAYVAPYCSKYLIELSNELENKGYIKDLLIMQSNSGIASSEAISQKPINLVLSGPASGPIGGVYFSKLAGKSDIITIDMGGTSFDVCLIQNNTIPSSTGGYIGRYRLALPTVDVHSLGAGGGSIAWVDPGGILHVGPKSSGAFPGPVCYDMGGTAPTVTDANLILGYLNPEYFLGGRMKLKKDLAESSLSNLAKELNLTLGETAQGIIDVVNNNMVNGIEEVSVKKGYNPKDFTLVVAGGAGPLHATRLADLVGINKIIIPRIASAFCAFGMAISDLRHDFVKPYIKPIKKVDLPEVANLFKEMESEGNDILNSEGIEDENINYLRSMDMRYIGQIYEVETPIPYSKFEDHNIKEIKNLFHKKHEQLYGYKDKDSDIEIVHIRAKVIGKNKPFLIKKTDKERENINNMKVKATRKVFFKDMGDYIKTNIYSGNELTPGTVLNGPAVIEEPDTTIVLFPSWTCKIDKYNNYILIKNSKNNHGESD